MINRFGVSVDWRNATIGALNTIALQADYSGCGYFWLPEAWGLEAFSTAAHLLTITKRIRIGTGIVNLYSRSAATISMACATLNQIAPGRFMLGLGTSGRAVVESFHGVRFEKKFQRTKEYIEAIRKIESGELADYEGEILRLSKFRLFTQAVKPPTPIYLGAIGEKNLILSGKLADGAIVTLWPISRLGECLKIVNSEAKGPKKIFSYIPVRITNNEREEVSAKMDMTRYISFYVASMGKYYAENLTRLGYNKQVEDMIAGSKSQDLKPLADEFLDDFCLIGRPAKVLTRIASLPEDVHPVFSFNASSSKEADNSARMIREISVELASRKPRPI